jgi:starch phosphorylase
VNADERIHERLKVVFVPNYNVSLAQIIIPAADISQHISTAGYEASGTSCMKFCMNGALLLGTWDGANIEIMDDVGHEQGYLFGLRDSDVEAARVERKSPTYKLDLRLNNVLKQIEGGMFGPASEFAPITLATRNNDHYLVASDFADYIATHEQIEKDWAEKDKWFTRSIVTSVNMWRFSSDRSIYEYAGRIWNIKPCRVPPPITVTSATAPK